MYIPGAAHMLLQVLGMQPSLRVHSLNATRLYQSLDFWTRLDDEELRFMIAVLLMQAYSQVCLMPAVWCPQVAQWFLAGISQRVGIPCVCRRHARAHAYGEHMSSAYLEAPALRSER